MLIHNPPDRSVDSRGRRCLQRILDCNVWPVQRMGPRWEAANEMYPALLQGGPLMKSNSVTDEVIKTY